MKRNRYLEEIGIKRRNHSNNYLPKDKYSLRCFLERRRYGFDFIEVLNLDYAACEWLYSHLAMFMEYYRGDHPEGSHCASDLSVCSIEFEGKTYTIEEAAYEIMGILKEYLQKHHKHHQSDWSVPESLLDNVTRAFCLFAYIRPFLWL